MRTCPSSSSIQSAPNSQPSARVSPSTISEGVSAAVCSPASTAVTASWAAWWRTSRSRSVKSRMMPVTTRVLPSPSVPSAISTGISQPSACSAGTSSVEPTRRPWPVAAKLMNPARCASRKRSGTSIESGEPIIASTGCPNSRAAAALANVIRSLASPATIASVAVSASRRYSDSRRGGGRGCAEPVAIKRNDSHMLTRDSAARALQPLLEPVELRLQLARQPLAELGVELPDRADLRQPLGGIDPQQLCQVLLAE